jgi:protein TonB
MMNLSKELPISIALHAVIVSALVYAGMSNSFGNKNNLIVIEFTLEDSLNAGDASSQHVKSQPSRTPPPVNRVADVKSRGSHIEKEKSQTEDTVPKSEVAVIQDIKPEPSEEIQSKNMANSEQTVVSVNRDTQDTAYMTSASASYGGDGSTGEALTKTDIKNAYSKSYGNTEDAKKSGYLKANFSYIKDMINEEITYPGVARQMGWAGMVKVSFIISSDGSVRRIEILKSSGFEILDRNAIEAVKKASPFPKPPAEAQIIIPILYKLN